MNSGNFICHYPGLISGELAESLILQHQRHEAMGTGLVQPGALIKTTAFQGQATLTDVDPDSPTGRGLLDAFLHACAFYFHDIVGEDVGQYHAEYTEVTIQRHWKNVGEPLPFFAEGPTNSDITLGMVANLNTLDDGGEVVFPFQAKTLPGDQGSIHTFPTTWPFFHFGPSPKSDDKYIATFFCHFIRK